MTVWLQRGLSVFVVWLAWVAVSAWLIQPFAIPSESMMSTLHVHDRVLVNKLSGGSAHRGDVIVFTEPNSWRTPDDPEPSWGRRMISALMVSSPREHLVKRVIGIGGDKVVCSHDTLSVNGVPIHEPYINHGMTSCSSSCSMPAFSVTVPQHSVWVMGDNRINSADSRCHPNGFVPTSQITGRVVGDMWPISRWGIHLSQRAPFDSVRP